MSAASNMESDASQRVFVDANVLVYAYDRSAGDKHEYARETVAGLWQERSGCIRVQVLQEFLVNVTRKMLKPLPAAQAREIDSDLSYWKTHSPTAHEVVEAIALHERLSFSFWDAMILRSAASLDCDTPYSEDLNSGQGYDGIRAHNPFPG